MIVSIGSEKTLDKIQHLLKLNVLEKLGMQDTYLNTIKAIYSKSIANINLNEEKMNAFPLNHGQDFSLSSYLFDIVLEVITRAIRQLKEIRDQRKTNCKGGPESILVCG